VRASFSSWIPLPLLALGILLPGLPGHWAAGPFRASDDHASVASAPFAVSPTDATQPAHPEAEPSVRKASSGGVPAGDVSDRGAPGTTPPTGTRGGQAVAYAAFPAVGEEVSPDGQALRGELLRMVQAPGWRTAEWGVLAVSLERGDTLFALNPHLPLAPASNLKLFTSAAALDRLGPGFRLPTFLMADGEIRDGVLHGDLILYGTGDPTLAGGQRAEAPEGAFAAFLQTLQAMGVKEIRGAIIGDGTFFQGDRRRASWNPRDLNDWFAAPASALSFNENMVTLQVVPGVAAGSPARIRIQPEGASVPIRNLGRTVDSPPSPSLLLVRDDPDGVIEIRGEIHRNGRDVWRSLTVSDPPAYAAGFLRQVLIRGGIGVTGPARSTVGDSAAAVRVTGRLLAAPAFGEKGAPRTLAVHHSPPLGELVEVVNKRSHNLYADLLLITLGHLLEEDPTFDGGARALTAYLVNEAGIAPEHLHIEDGSGLSRLNRSSPAALVRLLEHMSRSSVAEPFVASLPEAGNRRELRRMDRTPAAQNLRAKTGTIHRTSALSGIVRTADGEAVLFSIMANNVPSPGAAKRVEDRIGARLAGFARPWDVLPDPPTILPAEQPSITSGERAGLHR
jgi:serine-type D-Ala-D-Ala carboxypeptidase/endopeptidase (penicillin-binding protein 4)